MSSAHRPWRVRPPRRSAGRSRRARGRDEVAGVGAAAAIASARRATRRRGRAPPKSESAGRRGSSRACQRISSASRLPTPAIADWSISRAFSGARLPPIRARNSGRDLGGVRAQAREVGLEHRPSEPTRVAQREPASVLELESEAVPVVGRRLAVDHVDLDMPRCSPRVGPSSVSIHIVLPRRWAEHQLVTDKSLLNLAWPVGAWTRRCRDRRPRGSGGRGRAARSPCARARPRGAQARRYTRLSRSSWSIATTL